MYEGYKGRCIGRLMAFLYEYCHNSDQAIFHGEVKPMVTLGGKPLANYTWDKDTDIPTFDFIGDYVHLNAVQAAKKEDRIKQLKQMEDWS